MNKYEVTHYQINFNTIDVDHIDITVVYADTMHVSEGNTLMFFKLSEDTSMRAIKAWNDGVWIYAEQIEDEFIEPQENNRAELYAKAGLL